MTMKRLSHIQLLPLILLPALAHGSTFTTTNVRVKSNPTNTLPEHVTMCDNSSPVGLIAAYLLTQPLHYCMNHGTCRSDYATTHISQPCQCPEGFEGPHCEFATGTTPDCTKHCFAGGVCQAGAKSFELLETTPMEDLQYCLCPDGFQGDQCERQVERCGENHCQHGGTCTSITRLDGSVSQYCDCTTAENGAYAGRFCDHRATVFCAEDDPSGYAFCTNGGTCRGGSELGCDCPEGFIGPVCEFRNHQVEYSECKLECFNGGICRKGAKDISFLEKFGVHRHLAVERYNEDFEHCVCPSGLVGRQCEFQMDVCPGRDVVCMHGGTCRLGTNGVDGSTEMTCDCSTAERDSMRFMGDYCEVRATEFCTVDGLKPSRGANFDALCTQGGRCRDYVHDGDEHPGCDCPHGTSGDHCEYGEPLAIASRQRTSFSLWTGLLLGISGLALLAAAFLTHRRRRAGSRMRRARRLAATPKVFQDGPPPPSMDHIDNLYTWRKDDPPHGMNEDDRDCDEEGIFLNDHASVSTLGLTASGDFPQSTVSFEPPGWSQPLIMEENGVGEDQPVTRAQFTFTEQRDGSAILMKPAQSPSVMVPSDQPSLGAVDAAEEEASAANPNVLI